MLTTPSQVSVCLHSSPLPSSTSLYLSPPQKSPHCCLCLSVFLFSFLLSPSHYYYSINHTHRYTFAKISSCLFNLMRNEDTISIGCFIVFKNFLSSLPSFHWPITSLKAYQWSGTTSCSGHAQAAKCVVVLPPCLSATNPRDILQKWVTREFANKDKSAAKKHKRYTHGKSNSKGT